MARPTLQSTITESFTVLTCTSSCTSSSATHVRCAPIAIEVTSGLHRRNLGANVWTGRSLKTKNCWRFAKSDNIQKQMVTGGQKLGIVRHRRIWDLHTPQNRQYLIWILTTDNVTPYFKSTKHCPFLLWLMVVNLLLCWTFFLSFSQGLTGRNGHPPNVQFKRC